MKLSSFEVGGRASWGVVEGDEIADMGAALGGRFPDLRAAIAAEAYAEIRDGLRSAPRLALANVSFLPVIPNPDKILCVGLNYEDHRKETGRAEVANPTIFARFSNSQTGHLRGVPRPRISADFDYEGELAVVIGRGGRYIERGRALSHVAGYACYNDFSVRDWQWHTHQFTPGKNFPETGAFGPYLVTADEVGDLAPLRLQTRVNGEVVQSATFAQMIFDVARLIEYCSAFTRLEPGDVIVSGTPGGVGAKRTPPLWLKPGDVVEVEIDKVGLLSNRVCEEMQS